MSPPATIPIVNPTPTTTTPIVNPTPPSTPTYTDQPTTPTTTTGPTTSSGTWCIASQTASPTALQVALDYACGYGGADCSAIQPGGTCYNPSTLHDHASYAFNNYYQKNPIPTSCVFGGTAQLSTTDPSKKILIVYRMWTMHTNFLMTNNHLRHYFFHFSVCIFQDVEFKNQ